MEIQVDKSIYSKDVLLKTAYTFMDRVYIHLGQTEINWVVSWTNKEGINIKPEEFENELIQQQLRFDLLEQTKDIRKIVLARAYASTIIDKNDSVNEKTEQSDEPDILKGWFENND